MWWVVAGRLGVHPKQFFYVGDIKVMNCLCSREIFFLLDVFCSAQVFQVLHSAKSTTVSFSLLTFHFEKSVIFN